MSFDWQTEEDNDSDWDEQEWRDKPVTAVSSKPPWRPIMIITVLLLLVAGFIYQQVNKRLDEATTTMESDIFATHNLLSRAAANNDAQLGKAVLSGRDLGWSRIQSNLLTEGLFFEYSGLGLMLPEETAAFDPLSREDERFIDLTLDPDLSGATLLYARDYVALSDDGLQTVTLQQTAVYRQGETRWLLAPPLESFWGEWQTAELDNLTTIYPQRDEELLLEISADLQTLLTETCEALPELDCSLDVPIQIRFDTDPESLLETADPANLYDGNVRLNLPTPTLVGLPIDNDGYEALLNAYGFNMISALIGQTVGYECCDKAPMFQTIVTYQLSELGLTIWPVTMETQAVLADNGVNTDSLFPYWNSDDFSLIRDENSVQLFGFADFLVKEFASQQTPLAILTHLSSAQTYQEWLTVLSSSDINASFEFMDFISREWWFYAVTQSEETAVSSPPIPFPAQDLQVSCVGNGFTSPTSGLPQTELYRYQLENDRWTEEFSYPGLTFFSPSPQDDGLFLQLIEISGSQQWRTLWLQNGTSVEIADAENEFSVSLGQVDPNGRFLLYYSEASGEESLPTSRLVDIESCVDGNCNSTLLGATPHWSPDGQQTLLSELHLFENAYFTVDGRIVMLNSENINQVTPLQLSDRIGNPEENIEIGEGLAPFWITNDLFGFIQSAPTPDRSSAQELVVMSTADLEAEVVVTTADLRDQIPEDNRRDTLFMRYIIAHPTNPDLLLVMASFQANSRVNTGFLFQVNRQTQAVERLFDLNLSSGEHSLGFSPNGRYLVATGTWQQDSSLGGDSSPFGTLHIYDLETAEQQTILTNIDAFFPVFTFDWSADGNWLAFARDRNAIGLIAPAYNYQKTIIHQAGDCASLAWINPMP